MEEKNDDELRDNVIKYYQMIKPYLFILLLLIPLGISYDLRTTSLTAPSLEDHAAQYVHDTIYDNIKKDLIAKNPLLPPDRLEAETQKAYNNLLSTNGDDIKTQVELVYKSLLSNIQDDSGQTYLSAIDPYFWLRFTENYINTGHVYDELKDGRGWDNHMLAPDGRPVPGDMFHAYFQATVYKIWSFFDKSVSPMTTAYYSPFIIISFCIIIMFFLLYRLIGPFGGFVGSTMLAIHPFLLTRTYGGFADTDAYVVLFPLLAVWLFTESFITKKPMKGLLLAVLAGLSLGLFNFAWSGWWFIFDIMLAAAGVYFVYLLIKQKSFNKKVFVPLEHSLMLIVSTMILTGLNNIYLALIKYPFDFINLKSIATQSIWPNVFTTVAEQNPTTWSAVLNNVGIGQIWFLALCLIGLVVLFYKNKPLAIICLFWLGSTMWASTKGVRFILMVIPGFSICFGFFAGWMYKHAGPAVKKHLKLSKIITTITIVVIIVGVLFIPFSMSKDTSRSMMPDISDAWVKALTNIKNNSDENAIITSWWDFGHWFKYWADRQVTFDGTSQSYPQAHWVGRVLLTNDEQEAYNIIRMVHCSGDRAYKKALEIYGSPIVAIKNLKKIIMEDKKEVPSELVQLTHCDFPQTFVIVSQDMIYKSGVWAHFGAWDFDKAYQYNVVKNNNLNDGLDLLAKQYPENTNLRGLYAELKQFNNDQANSWISGWPSINKRVDGCIDSNTTIKCSMGLELNKENNTINFFGNVIPQSISYTLNNQFNKVSFDDANVDFSVVLYEQNDKMYTIYVDPVLVDSLFVRTFYLNGTGLDHFKQIDHQQGFGGDNVFVYEVIS